MERIIWRSLKVIALLRERLGHGLVDVLLILSHQGRIDLDNGWGQGGRLDELQVGVAGEHASEPDEGLLKVVVGLGRDVVVLEVLLSVECDLAGLDLALLHVDLVAAEHNGDVLADAHQVAVPVGHVLVGDAAGHVEHDDAALALDVVDVTETTKLFLAGRVPDVEDYRTAVGVEKEGADLDSNSG